MIENVLDVDSEQLQDSQTQSNTSARLLNALEMVAESIPLAENETRAVVARNNFAISVQEIISDEFHGQTFSAALGNDFMFEQSGIINSSLLFLEEMADLTVNQSVTTAAISA